MTFRLGTRGSKLALAQAGLVRSALGAAHPGIEIETVVITTSGDWKPQDGETRLSEQAGGKGLFAHEIEKSLLAGEIDFAVHSLKDMPSFLPEGLVIDHVLPRADVRDAFISHIARDVASLPRGAVVGTSSLRRQSMIMAVRPDLMIVPLRGNVETRLQKLKDGQVDATFLAMAGLNRLSITGDMIHALPVEDMLPACGQGIVGIETRAGDTKTRAVLNSIHHAPTGLCAFAERAVLQILDGSCHTPIGAHAMLTGEQMILRALVASPDGTTIYRDEYAVSVDTAAQAVSAGQTLGRRLKDVLPPGFLA